MPQLDRLRRLLPHVIELPFQDPRDDDFPYTLLYVGVKGPFRQDLTPSLGTSLALAWRSLFPWAVAVNQGPQVEADVCCDLELQQLSKILLDPCRELDSVRERVSEICRRQGISQDEKCVPP